MFPPQTEESIRPSTESSGSVPLRSEDAARHNKIRLLRQFQRDSHHVQAIHAHPARPVRLLQVAASRKWRGAVKQSYVVQSKKTALKNIHALDVFAVHPPGEIQQQLMKHFFEKPAIRHTT